MKFGGGVIAKQCDMRAWKMYSRPSRPGLGMVCTPGAAEGGQPFSPTCRDMFASLSLHQHLEAHGCTHLN